MAKNDESSFDDQETTENTTQAEEARSAGSFMPPWSKTYKSEVIFSDSSHGIITLGTDDCIITIDARTISYKPEPLEEILNSEFKSY
jgi:hypothetical protein